MTIRTLRTATACALGSAVLLVLPVGTASAAIVQMRNDPANYRYGSCPAPGTIQMYGYYTDRADLSSASYYDEKRALNGSGSWVVAGSTYLLNDYGTTTKYMTNSSFPGGQVRVRANAYVTTDQGPSCNQL